MKKLPFPHPLVLIFAFIFLAGILTYIIPSGKYQRTTDTNSGREVVVADSYQEIEAEPSSIYDMLLAIPKGIIEGADVIALIFIFGGAFFVVDKTGALQSGVTYLATRLRGKETTVLILVGAAFTAGGAMNNLQEEIIAMIPVLIILSRKLGYNNFVTIAISFGCAVIGASFSPINPFQVGIAQKIAEVPLLSGSAFRIVSLIVAFAIWMTMIIGYARKNVVDKEEVSNTREEFDPRHGIILALVGVAFGIMVYGLLSLGWGFNEMSAEFFVLGVVAGVIGRLGFNGTASAYVEGFKEMTFAALIVGFARAIYLVLDDGVIIDTIVYGLFTPLQYLPASLSAIAMMLSHILIHIPIPSVSGQAVLTMPLLTPLADLIGLSRQVMILAYQFGAGMTDMLTPTNGALMAVLAAAKVNYNEWFRFVFKRTIAIWIFAALVIIVGSLIGL